MQKLVQQVISVASSIDRKIKPKIRLAGSDTIHLIFSSATHAPRTGRRATHVKSGGEQVNIHREDLNWAAAETGMSSDVAERLWQKLTQRASQPGRASFDVANVAYYLGALIVMAALGWLMNLGWEKFGGTAICGLAVLYAVLFVFAGRTLWFKENLKVAGGLLFTLAVWMTPLAIYGFQQATGLWTQGAPSDFRDYHIWVKGSWIYMELGTILAGCVALKFIRFPFLTFPIAFSLWYMSMDLTPLLMHRPEFSYTERLRVSLIFGLLMLVAAYLVDRRTREDFAFWGYLFGLLAFWGGLSLMDSSSELNKFLYCLINLGLIFMAVFLQRKMFVIFGALGVFGYLEHLSSAVFRDSFLFPMAVTLLGLAVIYLGVQYQRHSAAIEQSILDMIPVPLRKLRPVER